MRIKVEPMGAPRQVRSDVWRPREVVLRYRAYRDTIRAQFSGDVPDDLRLRFHMAMPPSWSDKKRERMLGQPHRQKPDIDNLVKGFMDALLEDDSHVWRIFAEKVWSDGGGIETL